MDETDKGVDGVARGAMCKGPSILCVGPALAISIMMFIAQRHVDHSQLGSPPRLDRRWRCRVQDVVCM